MRLSEKTFQVLDALERKEISTQRELAEHSGVSLGQVNYILKSLLSKGLVKIGNFRKNPHKIRYLYLLTPKGIEAKSRLAVGFILSKLREYETLRTGLSDRLASLEGDGHSRIVFVGPSIVRDFLQNVIKESRLNLVITDHFENWGGVRRLDPSSFDCVLMFDGGLQGTKAGRVSPDIPREKVFSLW